jgi:hypothetical protein
MEESQRKLNDAISTMAGGLHRNYLRRIYVKFIFLIILLILFIFFRVKRLTVHIVVQKIQHLIH